MAREKKSTKKYKYSAFPFFLFSLPFDYYMIMNYISTTTTTSRPMRLAEPLITTATNHNSSSTSSSSIWQQLMVGAGSAAGSTAAVVSEESMKCLKYCLSWLQYAIRHLSQQMGLIRNFLVSLATSPQQPKQPQILASIKNDMVTTLRKVIDIITCYASNALPYQAKATVRGAILSLPSRWVKQYHEKLWKKLSNDFDYRPL